MFDGLTAWQIMYLVGIIAGVMVFIEIIGWITDECKSEYKGSIQKIKTAIRLDIERSKTLWCKHEEKR